MLTVLSRVPDLRHRRRAAFTVGALEPKFFQRLSELLERPDLAERQYDQDQEALAGELAGIFASRTLDAWLDHFADEDVCVGPVWTRDEAAAVFGSGDAPGELPLGAHTEAWRQELGLGPSQAERGR